MRGMLTFVGVLSRDLGHCVADLVADMLDCLAVQALEQLRSDRDLLGLLQGQEQLFWVGASRQLPRLSGHAAEQDGGEGSCLGQSAG